MIVIGVLGFIGAGKGTIGEILVANGFIQESFAKPLKDAAALIFGWDRELVEGATPESRAWREQEDVFWSKKLGKKVTPRLVLQWMGTEAGRNVFGENLWTAALQNRLDRSRNYVITDVRFENEIAAVEEVGGYIIRVKRGPDPDWLEHAKFAKLQECSNPALKSHTYLDQFNPEYEHIHRSEWDWVTNIPRFTITNDHNIWALRYAVFGMLDQIAGPTEAGGPRIMSANPFSNQG